MHTVNRYDSYFSYDGDVLTCEGNDIRAIAAEFGTPLYVYSERGFIDRYTELDRALSGIEHLICYSVKTNFNLSLIRMMGEQGSGVDVVSGGELFRALKAGIPAKRIVFAGVGKTAGEIADGIDADGGFSNFLRAFAEPLADRELLHDALFFDYCRGEMPLMGKLPSFVVEHQKKCSWPALRDLPNDLSLPPDCRVKGFRYEFMRDYQAGQEGAGPTTVTFVYVSGSRARVAGAGLFRRSLIPFH